MTDKKISQSTIMTERKFSEIINPARVKYLLTLKDSEIKKLFWNKDEQDPDGDTWDWKPYLVGIRMFLSDTVLCIDYNDALKDKKLIYDRKYRYATGRDYGRLYTRKFSIQSLQFRLRNFLITRDTSDEMIGKTYYTDIDIENCHFSILLGLVENYNTTLSEESQLEYKWLKTYVTKREQCFKKWLFKKKEALVLLNTDEITHNKKNKKAFYVGDNQIAKPQFFIDLHREIKQIKNTWLNDPAYDKYKDDLEGRKNPNSSFLNRILCDKEAQYLQKVIKFLIEDPDQKYIVPMFDGLLVSCEGISCTKKQEQLLLADINKLTKENKGHSINWVVKPIKDTADIDPEDIKLALDNGNLYSILKKKYEETRCFIKKTAAYQSQYKDKTGGLTWIHYPKSAMEEDGANQLCTNKKGAESNMFVEWRKDPLRRQYDDIDFIPYNPKENLKYPNIFNTFEGMNFEYDEEYEEILPDESLKEFLLNTLAGGDDDVYKYLYYTLAQIIQEPSMKTGKATIFSGEEGVGKDTIIYLLRKLLGNNCICATNKMEDIIPKRGSFNMELKDKLIVEFNETSGRDGNEYMEQIKDFITRENNSIRELYKAPYEQNNMVRLFLFTNGLNPITMKDGQRRFIWIKIKGDRKGDSEYWNNLYTDLNNKEWINKIGNELLNVDYGEYFKHGENMPETDVMKQYYKLNRPKEIDFLYNKIVKNNLKSSSGVFNLKNGVVFIETTKLYELFEKYCYKNSLPLTFEGKPWNSTHFKKMIEQFSGIETNKMRTFKLKEGTISKRMFRFNKPLLEETLNKKYNFQNEEDDEIINLMGECLFLDDSDGGIGSGEEEEEDELDKKPNFFS